MIVALEITDSCNLKCKYCCKTWRKDNIGTMSDETMNNLIRLIPASTYIINGGEPSIVMDRVRKFCELVPNANKALNSNMTGFTFGDIDYLRGENIRINASINTLKRDVYEQIHGNSRYFDKAMENLRYLAVSYPVHRRVINILVTNENKDEVLDVIKYTAYIGFTRFQVTPPIPNGEYHLTLQNTLDVLKSLNEFAFSHRNLTINTLMPIPLCWSKEVYNYSIEPSHTCIAGTRRLLIVSNGDIKPCGCFDGYVLGNINEINSIDEVLGKTKHWCNHSEFLHCDCEHKDQCVPCKGYIFNGGLL